VGKSNNSRPDPDFLVRVLDKEMKVRRKEISEEVCDDEIYINNCFDGWSHPVGFFLCHGA
jgi:hypothetical protein